MKDKEHFYDYVLEPIIVDLKEPRGDVSGLSQFFDLDRNWSDKLQEIKSPAWILINSPFIDLLATGITNDWFKEIRRITSEYSQHKFIYFTILPHRLIYHSYPPNWVLGIKMSALSSRSRVGQLVRARIKNERIIYFPKEQNIDNLIFKGIDWVVYDSVKDKEWLKEIEERCARFNVPLYNKSSEFFKMGGR